MKSEPLYEKIYGDVLNDIRNGVYTKGDRLPSEKELSEHYSVSRITSKKALEKLSEQGMIIRMPGKGSFVSETVSKEQNPLVARNEKTTLIGVIMDGFGASFGVDLMLGMEEECRRRNFSMLLKCSHGNKNRETDGINEVLSHGAEGIIIMCVHEENFNPAVLRLVVENFPVVAIDRKLRGIPVSFVGTDNEKAARELTAWLFAKGYRSLCFVSHDAVDTPTVLERQSGFQDCCIENGVLMSESITSLKSTLPRSRNEENLKKDREFIKEYIQKHSEVDAFFAVEYEIARIVYRILCELDLEEQYPVVCFDEVGNILEESKFTHVRQKESKIGEMAVGLLAKKLEGDNTVDTVLIPYDVVEATKIKNK